ncbi:MAG: acyl--CoA ligase [Oscillospiraceae bacterium]|jgi:fatty-acyl-CoA synthase|nr:acyl--CoA ligase [Oscillospiraceae bacterium]
MALKDITLHQQLAGTVEKYPDDPFAIWADTNHIQTWKDLDNASNAIAKALIAHCIRPGGHVGIWSTKRPVFTDTLYGVLKAGGVFIPYNYSYKAAEFAGQLSESDTELLILTEGTPNNAFADVIASLDRGAFPKLQTIVWAGNADTPAGMVSYADFLAAGEIVSDSSLQAAGAAVTPQDTALIMYTSGTTGTPKGVMLSHYSVVNAANVYAYDYLKGSHADVSHTVLPLHHMGGLLNLFALIEHGAASVMREHADIKQMYMDAVQYRCTVAYYVPLMCMAFLKIASTGAPKPPWRALGVGADRCPPEILSAFTSVFNCTIIHTLAPTESGCLMNILEVTPGRKDHLDTVGLTVPDAEVRLADNGEILVRGWMNMQGYYGHPELTASVIEPDGFLHTGDLGEILPDGYLRFKGRVKDLIISGGSNISALEVEEVLLTYPGIRECAVVGIPDAMYGELPVAAVAAADPAAAPPADALLSYAQEHLAAYKVPSTVYFLPALPRNSTGKIDKAQVKAYIAQQ